MIPRLRRDEQRRRRIFEHMEKFIANGFAEEIPPEEVDEPVEGPLWYLPIHIVEKKGNTRPCHNARASVDGICLNDQLLGGPNRPHHFPPAPHHFPPAPHHFPPAPHH